MTIVTTFYHFAPLEHPASLKHALLEYMASQNIRGTITLAREGINATVAGSDAAVRALLATLRALPGFSGLKVRESVTSDIPFKRMKIKIKRELISLGAKADPSVCVGQYVTPSEWNALIAQPDVVTVDTRNDYEYAIGHFRGAVNPATRHFKEMVAFTQTHLSPERTPRVAMYCTGGIRCEKYSAYLLTQGFTEVYHLQGGILAYLETVPEVESMWEGECFVFDTRIAVGHELRPTTRTYLNPETGEPFAV
jgi:UPF0176 protein